MNKVHVGMNIIHVRMNAKSYNQLIINRLQAFLYILLLSI